MKLYLNWLLLLKIKYIIIYLSIYLKWNPTPHLHELMFFSKTGWVEFKQLGLQMIMNK